jgi:hypothetical protein
MQDLSARRILQINSNPYQSLCGSLLYNFTYLIHFSMTGCEWNVGVGIWTVTEIQNIFHILLPKRQLEANLGAVVST